MDHFGFLWGLKLSNLEHNEKGRLIMDLCEKYPNYLNSIGFTNELETLPMVLKTFGTQTETLDKMEQHEIL